MQGTSYAQNENALYKWISKPNKNHINQIDNERDYFFNKNLKETKNFTDSADSSQPYWLILFVELIQQTTEKCI